MYGTLYTPCQGMNGEDEYGGDREEKRPKLEEDLIQAGVEQVQLILEAVAPLLSTFFITTYFPCFFEYSPTK